MAYVLEPAEREVLAELERLLASPRFTRADRMARFLRYSVERSLIGSPNDLKELIIGREVFDRDESYDPRVDPVVRVEARRLRAKLVEYYAGEGAFDPVIIEFPKGSYATRFRLRDPRPQPSRPPGARLTRRLVRIAAAAVILSAAGLWAVFRAISNRIDTIAVVPVIDLDHPGSPTELAAGLGEELAHNLGRLSDLKVHPHAAPGGHGEPALLEASIRMAGNRARIAVRLVRTTDRTQLWTRTYDRLVDDSLAVEQEIGRATANSIARAVGLRRPAGDYTGSNEAREAYWNGRWYFRHWQLERAEKSYNLALSRDPGFALAWAALADVYAGYESNGDSHGTPDFSHAVAAASRALEIDPDLVEGHLSLAIIRTRQYDWRASDAEFRTAIAVNPNHAETRGEYALVYLIPQRRFAEAIRESELSVRLAPDSYDELLRHGTVLVFAREYARAVPVLRRAIDLRPAESAPRQFLAEAHLATGHAEDAVKVLNGDPLFTAIALATARRTADAESWASTAFANHPGPVHRAYLLAALGRQTDAARILESDSITRSAWLPFLVADPQADALRSAPEFHALLKRIRLEN